MAAFHPHLFLFYCLHKHERYFQTVWWTLPPISYTHSFGSEEATAWRGQFVGFFQHKPKTDVTSLSCRFFNFTYFIYISKCSTCNIFNVAGMSRSVCSKHYSRKRLIFKWNLQIVTKNYSFFTANVIFAYFYLKTRWAKKNQTLVKCLLFTSNAWVFNNVNYWLKVYKKITVEDSKSLCRKWISRIRQTECDHESSTDRYQARFSGHWGYFNGRSFSRSSFMQLNHPA